MYKLSTAAHHPHDALTAASAALTTLSLLIGTHNELSLEARECYGLSIMLDAIRDDMNKVAEVIESDRCQYERPRQTTAAEYERGYQNGRADGLLHAARLNAGDQPQEVAQEIYRGAYADGAKSGWIAGWQRAHGKPTRFDRQWQEEDVSVLMAPLPGEEKATPEDAAPVPKLTEEGEQGSGASKSA